MPGLCICNLFSLVLFSENAVENVYELEVMSQFASFYALCRFAKKYVNYDENYLRIIYTHMYLVYFSIIYYYFSIINVCNSKTKIVTIFFPVFIFTLYIICIKFFINYALNIINYADQLLSQLSKLIVITN